MLDASNEESTSTEVRVQESNQTSTISATDKHSPRNSLDDSDTTGQTIWNTFRGVRLGSNAKGYAGMTLAKRINSKAKIDIYIREEESKKLGQSEITNVFYHTLDDDIYSITIVFEDTASYDNLVNLLSERYGDPDPMSSKFQDMERKESPSSEYRNTFWIPPNPQEEGHYEVSITHSRETSFCCVVTITDSNLQYDADTAVTESEKEAALNDF